VIPSTKGCLRFLHDAKELKLPPVVWPIVLYSLSSSVTGRASALEGMGQGPPSPLSVLIFLLRREFSSLNASISSTFLFLYSANSCCILAWASKIREIFDEDHASPTSTVGTLVGTSAALLLVDTMLSNKELGSELAKYYRALR